MWTCLKRIYNNSDSYKSMVKAGKSCFNTMQNGSGYQWLNKLTNNNHSALIEPLSYDQVCAIHLYTTDLLYTHLSEDIAKHQVSKWADYVCELIVGINKLPMTWEKPIGDVNLASYLKNDATFFDGINSTSSKQIAVKKIEGIEVEGYHRRDITPFSRNNRDQAGTIYVASSHFQIYSICKGDGIRWYKVREMPFPWNNTAILWVDDNPESKENKELRVTLEREGKMVIPRESTKAALDYLKFMQTVFINKFRIISDMTRYERKDEYKNSETTRDTKAGATFVSALI